MASPSSSTTRIYTHTTQDLTNETDTNKANNEANKTSIKSHLDTLTKEIGELIKQSTERDRLAHCKLDGLLFQKRRDLHVVAVSAPYASQGQKDEKD
jgi:hypothetical protein